MGFVLLEGFYHRLTEKERWMNGHHSREDGITGPPTVCPTIPTGTRMMDHPVPKLLDGREHSAGAGGTPPQSPIV